MFKELARAIRWEGLRRRLVRAVRPTKVYYRPLSVSDCAMKVRRPLR